ncbi:MAG TPA: methylmalonyl Co-A mutase-associated GTPase MeaB [Pyrinomonadaceae bacterium]|nr:methylmalonyl Co-A mutase-associated GTPase MeaB [Pyrinomonadaceae bacterium]
MGNESLVERVLAGEPRAVARAISKVEDGAEDAGALMKALFAHTGRGLVVGITGAPGAGKSSLVDRLAALYRRRGERVGIVAVDPSSPFSGGAILGDRIRMQALGLDPGVFIRSMATRGNLGGLARATVDAVAILDAAGYQKIIVETVGVGQDEVEIVKTADVSVVVLVPGMGDDIQAIKAGIMEIGDVFVINKADRDGVLRTEKELEALLSLAHRPDLWSPPIVRTVATENKGLEELASAIESYRDFQKGAGAGSERRRSIARWRLLELLRERLLARALETEGARERLDELARGVADKRRDPYSAVEEFIATGTSGGGGRPPQHGGSPMFERYTDKARRVIFFARYEAHLAGGLEITPEHLLLGLAREDGQLFKSLLGERVSVDALRGEVEARLPKAEKVSASVELPLAAEAKRVLAFAHDESEGLGHRHVGTEHLLLGLLRAGGTVAEEILRGHGLSLAGARESVTRGEIYSRAHHDSQAVAARLAASKESAAFVSATALRVEHIGIATPRLDDALRFWRDALGLEVRHTEVVEEQGVRVAMLPAGEPRIELLEPTGEDSPVAKFLQKRGPGIHHVAVRVPDIRAALARLAAQGVRLIDAEPRLGAGGCLVAFVHPQSAGGVLLELVEHVARESEPER